MAKYDGYVPVYYACVNSPGFTKKTSDGHTYGKYEYGNAAGARWGSALRPKTCSKCDGVIVTGKDWPAVRERQKITLDKE